MTEWHPISEAALRDRVAIDYLLNTLSRGSDLLQVGRAQLASSEVER